MLTTAAFAESAALFDEKPSVTVPCGSALCGSA
jgi:uncharacterized membrane protein YadS